MTCLALFGLTVSLLGIKSQMLFRLQTKAVIVCFKGAEVQIR